MSLVHLPNVRKGASPEQSTVHNMLVENGQIIETIAEYQRMGRIEDAMKYQELLHRNILYLTQLAEPELASQLQQETNGISNGGNNNISAPFPPNPSNAPFLQQRPPNSNGLPPTQQYPSTSPHLQHQGPTHSSYAAPPPTMMVHNPQQLNGTGGPGQQQYGGLPVGTPQQYQQTPPNAADIQTAILQQPGHFGQMNSLSPYPNTSQPQPTSSSGAPATTQQQQPSVYMHR